MSSFARSTDNFWVFLSFTLALIAAIVGPTLLSSIPLSYFAPFLVLLFYVRPESSCLWWSLGCGLFIDLVSANLRLGVHAIAYCLTTFLLYKQKQHFFQDRFSTLPLMTFLFSACSSLICRLLLELFTTGFALSLSWMVIDLLLLPVIDAFYGALLFSLPAYLLRRRPTMHDNTLSKIEPA